MSVRAFDRIDCPEHGDTIAHYRLCVCCHRAIAAPTQPTDNTTRAARTRKQRQRDRLRMRKARSVKAAGKVAAQREAT